MKSVSNELKHPEVVLSLLDNFKRTFTFIAAGEVLLLANLGNTLLSGEPKNILAFRVVLGLLVFGVVSILWIGYTQREDLLDFACRMPGPDRDFLIKKRSELTCTAIWTLVAAAAGFIFVSMLFLPN